MHKVLRRICILTFACGATLILTAPTVSGASWSGSGSFTMSSTPSYEGACTGTGTWSLDLSGDSSALTGTFSLSLENVSSACGGSFAAGSITSQVSGELAGNSLTLSDTGQNQLAGTFSDGDLSLTDTWATPSDVPGSNGNPGSTCGALCHTVFTGSMTGSGDLVSGSSGGLSPELPGTPNLDLRTLGVALSAIGVAAGFTGLGLGAASFPGRMTPSAGRAFVSRHGFRRRGSGGWGEVHSGDHTYTATAAPSGVTPPVSGEPSMIGPPPSTASIPIAGYWIPPNPPVTHFVPVITSFISINGIPINPNFGDRAILNVNPNTGKQQYWDWHTGEFFNAYPPGVYPPGMSW